MRRHSALPLPPPGPARGDWRVIRTLLPYLWAHKGRVILAMAALVAAKAANVGVPLLMKSNSLVGKPIDLWTTWVLPPNARDFRGRYMSVLARLKPGVTLQQARAEMSALGVALATELPAFERTEERSLQRKR